MENKSYKAVEGRFQDYFKEIRKKYSTGDYTEGTLRTPFENFIKSLDKNFDLIQEPKRVQELGAPDFKAFNRAVKIGYIETKDLDKNLDNEFESEQIKKYRESIDNIILTNYSRFILLRDNKKIFDSNLFGLSDLKSSRYVIPDDKIREFLDIVDTFFTYEKQTIRSPKELAKELSKKARLLKDLAKEQLEEDLLKVKDNEETSSIYDFYEGLKELITDINVDDCADAYAQTITYGLFLAKKDCPNKLDRKIAASYIPRSIGVIKRIFINISGYSLPSNLSWIVDEIIDILNASDIKDILSEIDFRGKKDRDPFTFFYEDFLSQYDPKKRKHLGIFYTPRPVINFIVNSVNQILKRDFNKLRGFAEDDVTVLDPCVGTGTFLWLAFILTLVELKNSGLRGLIKQKIENHILRDFYGFEILVTPYIIAHLKLTMVLEKWFYKLKDKDRIQVYLTNTLDPSRIEYFMSPFLKEITKESETANRLKLEKPILIIIGNPPYSVSSSNKSKWIMEKMKDYKKDLDEKNIQPLSDDYIKFIRFAQWKIEQNKQGVIGLITNNSYLDGIIHRQMRKELLNAFDRIYILNLHGSIRREECTEKKDENVFDIQQGVAIALFIKNNKFKDKKVFYADLFGKREDKYLWLDKNRVNTVEWQELKPTEPYYFFIKKDLSKIKIYEKFYSVKQIFRNFNMGVATGKDKIFVDFSNKNLLSKLSKLKPKPEQDLTKPYYYRPFDIRSVYYDKILLQRARYNIMKHFLSENIGLCLVRQGKKQSINCLVTQNIICRDLVTNHTYIFPLYIYNEEKEKSQQKSLSGEVIKTEFGKQPNFTEGFIEFIGKQHPNQKINPEDILGYIYAVLHSPMYRERFNEFLKIDFPRIPFVKDFRVFEQLSKIGMKLINLHLMKTKLKTNTKFDVQDSNIVEFVKYKDNKIYINKDQFFDGIPEKAWNFYIGGYKVLDKWLKSRKNRELSGDEMEQFLQIVEIINQTMAYMKEIDKIKFL